MNRATFYLHYSDKDAVLLLDAMTSVMNETAAGAAAAPQAELDDPDHPPPTRRRSSRSSTATRRSTGASSGRTAARSWSPTCAAGLQDAIATELVRRAPARMPAGVSAELLAAFLAGAIFAAATLWLDESRRRPPDQIAAAVWVLVSATVSAIPEAPPKRRSRR